MTINERAAAEGVQMIRVKLGGDPIPGWMLVDNYMQLLDAQDGTIDQILAVGVVQTMPRWMTVKLLRNWFAKLRPTGLLAIEMPDMDKAIIYLKRDESIQTPLGFLNIGQWALYGEQWEGGVPNQYVWTAREFVRELNAAGFYMKEANHDAKFNRKGLDMWVVAERVA